MKFISTLIICCCLSLLGYSQTNWEQKSFLPGVARNHPVTFSIDGKGYVVTGFQAPSRLLNDFYEYDPATNNWTTKASFPGSARGFAYGASYNGKGYVGFGLSGGTRLNDLWEYDPGTDSWTQLATCPCSGRRHPAFVITSTGKLYVGMGDDAVIGDLRDWWEYDIATNTWSGAATLPGPARHHPYYFAIGTDAYVGFGHSGTNIYNDFYRYNSLNNTWTQMRDFPGEARVAGAQFDYAGFGYIVSGEGSDHQNLDTGEFYRYDPRLDSWFEQEPHPGAGRWATGTFVIDDMVYVVAGQDERGVDLNDMWAFDLNRTVIIAGKDEMNESKGIQIYPNPANDKLQVRIETNSNYRITDLSGKTLMSGELSGLSNSLDVSALAQGFYFLEVESERVKFLKQ